MTAITNPLQAINSVFLKPNCVFESLSKVNNWSWLPFILLIATALLSVHLYFNFVDFEWYKETLIQQTYQDTSPAEKQAFRDQMTQDFASMAAMTMVIIAPIIMNAVLAVYLNAMTRNDDSHTNGFTDWYGATWWVAMPSMINSLIAIFLLVIASDHQIMPTNLQPLSLAFFLGTEMGSLWFNFLSSVRIDTLWSIYLMVVCISQWTSFDSRKSAIIAIAPFAVIYGLWLVFIVF
jgi:hypothetical protein